MPGDPHPAATPYADRSAAELLAYTKLNTRVVVADVDEVRNTDFSLQYGGLYVRDIDANFKLDTADTAVDDGVSTIIDAAGNHFVKSDVTVLTMWVPARRTISRSTNGAADGSVEMTANKNMLVTKDFDATTAEYVQFDVLMPLGWNGVAPRFSVAWSHAATTTNFGVAFQLAGVVIEDGGAGDIAFGTAALATDTGGATNATYLSAQSTAITIAGAAVAGDLVQFQLNRAPANAADTLAVDARLHGVFLHVEMLPPVPPRLDFSLDLYSQYLGAL